MSKMKWIPDVTDPKQQMVYLKFVRDEFKKSVKNWEMLVDIISKLAGPNSKLPTALLSFVDLDREYKSILKTNRHIDYRSGSIVSYIDTYINKHYSDIEKLANKFLGTKPLKKTDLTLRQAEIIYYMNTLIFSASESHYLTADLVAVMTAIRTGKQSIQDGSGKVLDINSIFNNIERVIDYQKMLYNRFVTGVAPVKDPIKHFSSKSNTKLTPANVEFLMGSGKDGFGVITVALGVFAIGAIINAMGTARSVAASTIVHSSKMVQATTRSLELLKLDLENEINNGNTDPAKRRELEIVTKQINRQRALLSKVG